MKIPPVITIDFETKGIESRPEYPPLPVGVSIKWPKDRKAKYYAWGHPTKNNCHFRDAQKALKEAWESGIQLLFHNAKFDIDVAETHMMMEPLTWEQFHDTLFLLFLNDPHSDSLALKAAAEQLLDMPPEERDVVVEWLKEHSGIKLGKGEKWGKYLSEAPGDIVGAYANGDVMRTEGLFKYLYPIVCENGMKAAYERELKLLPIFLESERVGLRVDVDALRRDIPVYHKELAKAEAWLRKRLKITDKDFNFDSDAEVAKALDATGVVTEWTPTKTGKRSVSKKNMTVNSFNDNKVFLVLGYRNRLVTCLRMFMEPWLIKAEANEGYIHPNWNQVRQPKGDDSSKGTRTGRPSCSDPNLLNVSKSFEDRGDDWTHPKFLGVKELPLIRKYTLPDPGCVWLHRDYNQQELRLLAHFEDGALMQAYKQDLRMDVHTFIQGAVKSILGKLFDRVTIKTTVFGRIYGQGVPALAQRLRVSIDEVKEVRDAQNKALPGLPDLDRAIKDNAKAGEPIVTWGGRVYHCEPPKYVEKFGREMTFEYKLLNYLIQGSAADATKEAVIRWYYNKNRIGRFVVTVYDEINICAPKPKAKPAMALLRECMESIEVDVPLLTDGKAGESWGSLEKVSW